MAVRFLTILAIANPLSAQDTTKTVRAATVLDGRGGDSLGRVLR